MLVLRAVGRPQRRCRNEHNVDDGANEAAAERHELGERHDRIAEVEPIDAEHAKKDRQTERNVVPVTRHVPELCVWRTRESQRTSIRCVLVARIMKSKSAAYFFRKETTRGCNAKLTCIDTVQSN